MTMADENSQDGRHRADEIECATCDDSGAIRLEVQIGVPGSGGAVTCPDCGPRNVEVVNDDE